MVPVSTHSSTRRDSGPVILEPLKTIVPFRPMSQKPEAPKIVQGSVLPECQPVPNWPTVTVALPEPWSAAEGEPPLLKSHSTVANAGVASTAARPSDVTSDFIILSFRIQNGEMGDDTFPPIAGLLLDTTHFS